MKMCFVCVRARVCASMCPLSSPAPPRRIQARRGCFHPALRRAPQPAGAKEAVVHLHDVGDETPSCVQFNPLRRLFSIFGLAHERHANARPNSKLAVSLAYPHASSAICARLWVVGGATPLSWAPEPL